MMKSSKRRATKIPVSVQFSANAKNATNTCNAAIYIPIRNAVRKIKIMKIE